MSLNNQFAIVPRGPKHYQRFIIHFRKPTCFSSFYEYYIECNHNQYDLREIAGSKRYQQLVSQCFLCPICPSVFSEHYHKETRACNILCTPERLVYQPPLPIEQDSTHDCSQHYIFIRQQTIPSRIIHDFSPHFVTEYSWSYAITIIHGATCFPPSPAKPKREPRVPRRMREKPEKKKRKRRRRKRLAVIAENTTGQCVNQFESPIGNIGEGLPENVNSPIDVAVDQF